MSATDPTKLRQRLEELLLKLERFDKDLAGDFTSLDTAWSRLDQAWDGMAYQEFVGHWSGVRSMIQQYTNMSSRYEQFLKERIAALEKVERTGGI